MSTILDSPKREPLVIGELYRVISLAHTFKGQSGLAVGNQGVCLRSNNYGARVLIDGNTEDGGCYISIADLGPASGINYQTGDRIHILS